jgi:outer membrane lipoprotein-sorting protein
MNKLISARRLRWAAPAVVAAAIAAAALTSNVAANASGQPKLPARTAAQLLVAVQQAAPAGLSGTVVETAKLGLPSLPDIGGAGGSSDLSVENLVTGSHTVRVWEAGATKQRLALLGQLSESDIIHNGTDLWTYSSTTLKVTHSTLADSADKHVADKVSGTLTPQDAATQALAAIDPTTTVQVDSTARVAGRASYQLTLQPKDARSLVGVVRIAIDAATSVPLRVQVFAKGATSPAIDVGFTDVGFSVPSASIFNFVPPAGSTVTQSSPFGFLQGGSPGAHVRVRTSAGSAQPDASAPPVTSDSSSEQVLGKGWTSVVELAEPGPTVTPGGSRGDGADPGMAQLLDQASTPVAGGRLLTTALLSVFIADDGRIFVGPVSAAAIQQVASTGKGL